MPVQGWGSAASACAAPSTAAGKTAWKRGEKGEQGLLTRPMACKESLALPLPWLPEPHNGCGWAETRHSSLHG